MQMPSELISASGLHAPGPASARPIGAASPAVGGPVLTFRGLPIYDADEFIYELEEAIEKTTRTFSIKSKKQEYNLIDALKITCRKCAKELTGKRPFININLVRI